MRGIAALSWFNGRDFAWVVCRGGSATLLTGREVRSWENFDGPTCASSLSRIVTSALGRGEVGWRDDLSEIKEVLGFVALNPEPGGRRVCKVPLSLSFVNCFRDERRSSSHIPFEGVTSPWGVSCFLESDEDTSFGLDGFSFGTITREPSSLVVGADFDTSIDFFGRD